jgi:hypothetical protein
MGLSLVDALVNFLFSGVCPWPGHFFISGRCPGQFSGLWGGLIFLIPEGCAGQGRLFGFDGPFSCHWRVCRPIFRSLEMCWSCFWSLGDSLVR